ncbi:4774_t:CDS:2, partial [Paraglomus occultum]
MAETIVSFEYVAALLKQTTVNPQLKTRRRHTIEDLEIDYGTQSDENLNVIQLRERVTECKKQLPTTITEGITLTDLLTVIGTANILHKTHT